MYLLRHNAVIYCYATTLLQVWIHYLVAITIAIVVISGSGSSPGSSPGSSIVGVVGE
jgi:hypothetical protein